MQIQQRGAEPQYDFIGRRVDEVSIVIDKPLKPGSYNLRVDAYNEADHKLAQNGTDIKFSVK